MPKLSVCIGFLICTLVSCKEKNKISQEKISELGLKRGDVVLCGSGKNQFGVTNFNSGIPLEIKEEFNQGISLLHSFEYDEAEKVFAKIIDTDSQCAMAYWGVAMSNFHLLWAPPNEDEIKKGARSIDIATSLITDSDSKEAEYIHAAALLYKNTDKQDHRSRCISYENAMEKIYSKYPDDKEAAIFYALALRASSDPLDKTFKNQIKAGVILDGLYPDQPNHPGIAHYIIHTYDYPELAERALAAARKYASIAPGSAHAQHMPSHIFVRLGLWDECISSNLTSSSSAKCYAESNSLAGHWDEELHVMDYLVYGYLQKGENKLAKEQCDYLKTIDQVSPMNFKVAYAFAAIPSRYTLENKLWQEATAIQIHPQYLPWNKFPWQEAILHFARLLGMANTGDFNSARAELLALKSLREILLGQKEKYKANLVDIQIKTGESWLYLKADKDYKKAIELMTVAASMEDATEKDSVTPGEVIPARELLGDMFLQINEPAKALEAYEADLLKHANRFNALYGAALAADKSGNKEKAIGFYKRLIAIGPTSQRIETIKAKEYLRMNN